MEHQEVSEKDIENILELLDGFASGQESRMKLRMSEQQMFGTTEKVYHHGRCDIGSPWATGECFDAPEGDCDR